MENWRDDGYFKRTSQRNANCIWADRYRENARVNEIIFSSVFNFLLIINSTRFSHGISRPCQRNRFEGSTILDSFQNFKQWGKKNISTKGLQRVSDSTRNSNAQDRRINAGKTISVADLWYPHCFFGQRTFDTGRGSESGWKEGGASERSL